MQIVQLEVTPNVIAQVAADLLRDALKICIPPNASDGRELRHILPMDFNDPPKIAGRTVAAKVERGAANTVQLFRPAAIGELAAVPSHELVVEVPLVAGIGGAPRLVAEGAADVTGTARAGLAHDPRDRGGNYVDEVDTRAWLQVRARLNVTMALDELGAPSLQIVVKKLEAVAFASVAIKASDEARYLTRFNASISAIVPPSISLALGDTFSFTPGVRNVGVMPTPSGSVAVRLQFGDPVGSDEMDGWEYGWMAFLSGATTLGTPDQLVVPDQSDQHNFRILIRRSDMDALFTEAVPAAMADLQKALGDASSKCYVDRPMKLSADFPSLGLTGSSDRAKLTCQFALRVKNALRCPVGSLKGFAATVLAIPAGPWKSSLARAISDTAYLDVTLNLSISWDLVSPKDGTENISVFKGVTATTSDVGITGSGSWLGNVLRNACAFDSEGQAYSLGQLVGCGAEQLSAAILGGDSKGTLPGTGDALIPAIAAQVDDIKRTVAAKFGEFSLDFGTIAAFGFLLFQYSEASLSRRDLLDKIFLRVPLDKSPTLARDVRSAEVVIDHVGAPPLPPNTLSSTLQISGHIELPAVRPPHLIHTTVTPFSAYVAEFASDICSKSPPPGVSYAYISVQYGVGERQRICGVRVFGLPAGRAPGFVELQYSTELAPVSTVVLVYRAIAVKSSPSPAVGGAGGWKDIGVSKSAAGIPLRYEDDEFAGTPGPSEISVVIRTTGGAREVRLLQPPTYSHAAYVRDLQRMCLDLRDSTTPRLPATPPRPGGRSDPADSFPGLGAAGPMTDFRTTQSVSVTSERVPAGPSLAIVLGRR